jgi:hypothetical protein
LIGGRTDVAGYGSSMAVVFEDRCGRGAGVFMSITEAGAIGGDDDYFLL